MDCWFEVLLYLSWSDCANVCKVFPRLMMLWRKVPREHLLKLTKTHHQYMCVERSQNWHTVQCIMEMKCEICLERMRTKMHSFWNVHAHETCINKQLIFREKACQEYDLSLHDIRDMPCDTQKKLWRFCFHSLLHTHTLEGLVQAKFHTSLKKRKEQVTSLKHDFQENQKRAKNAEKLFLKQWNHKQTSR